MSVPAVPPSARPSAAARYRAGCERSVEAAPRAEDGALAAEFAYTALAFPECPTCPHRLEPAGAPPFCVWRREDAPHPFAGLAGLADDLDPDPASDPGSDGGGS